MSVEHRRCAEDGTIECPHWNGSGIESGPGPSGLVGIASESTTGLPPIGCERCHGEKRVTCRECDGTGEVPSVFQDPIGLTRV